MELMDVILQRRSVRSYANKNIPQNKLEKILRAGLLAPTSRDIKPCEFYVIHDKDILAKLSKAKKMGAEMLADCDAAIAVFGDSSRADTWVEDCSIAMSYMNLMAADQGIGCCWVQMRLRFSQMGMDAEDNVREILNVPARYRIVGLLALGIPEKEIEPHITDDADFSKVREIL